MREQTRNLFVGTPSKRYPRYIGVEIECGKIHGAHVRGFHNVYQAAQKWSFRIGSDGSIREFAQATEISSTPARGDHFDEQITDLGKALIADEMRANSSCGLHVHVDVRDYTLDHLLGFNYLYYRLEKALYLLVAKSRRTTHYCKPWGEHFKDMKVFDPKATPKERERRLDVALYGSAQTAQSIKLARSRHDSRYRSVNFNAIPVHGTIEFRLHHGTVNPTKIKMWSAVCCAMVQYAFEHSEEEIRALRGASTHILEKVIGDPEVIEWTRARRLMFANMERKNRGLPPRAKEGSPRVTKRLELAGEVEMSEENRLTPSNW